MAVLRNQDYFTVEIGALAAGVPLAVTLPRPVTTPALSNNIDHVTNPPARREFEAGHVIITPGEGTAILADLLLTEVAFVADPDSPFTDGPEPNQGVAFIGSAPEPIFPTGTTTPTNTRVAFTNAAGINFDSPLLASLGGFLANLYVHANERVRLTFMSPGGGAGGNLRVAYDTGRHSADMGLQSPS